MTAQELFDELGKILKVHPEAGDALIWASLVGEFGKRKQFKLNWVGLDQKHKPARLKLEE